MPIFYINRLMRAELQANPKAIFVFGDNMQRRGLGGQAKEARGEPNALGIPTKWTPGTDEAAYFTDEDADNRAVDLAFENAFHLLMVQVLARKLVVFPLTGIGTGRAELQKRAPKIWKRIWDEWNMIQKADASLKD